VGQPDTMAGVPVETVVAQLQSGEEKGTVTYYIGKEDHLLRRVTTRTPKTATEPAIETTETHFDIRINPDLPAATFTFVPPSDAEPVASLSPEPVPPQPPAGTAPLVTSGEPMSVKIVPRAVMPPRVVSPARSQAKLATQPKARPKTQTKTASKVRGKTTRRKRRSTRRISRVRR
ncbi:MAG: DUF2092 domain-containing protein, partial [Armatimonadota bacterium]|nr:DUF2092 domain-containing protein [Armatimonadota bacterium]